MWHQQLMWMVRLRWSVRRMWNVRRVRRMGGVRGVRRRVLVHMCVLVLVVVQLGPHAYCACCSEEPAVQFAS